MTQYVSTVLESSDHGLSGEAFIATIVYAFTGIAVMMIAMVAVNAMFNLNIHRELVKEHNTAFGILFGCISIAIAIIIASTIVG